MKVLDASTAVNAIVHGPLQNAALHEILVDDLASPTLIDAEVLSALARLERAGRLDAREVEAAVEDWSTISIDRFQLPPLLSDVWELRTRMQIADAFYVALARALQCPLLTSDGKLARAGIPGVDVRLLG